MKINVLFFGSTRELTGISSMDLEITKETVTTDDLIQELIKIYPNINVERDQLSIAVNKQYCKAVRELKDGDEVALLPPISGG